MSDNKRSARFSIRDSFFRVAISWICHHSEGLLYYAVLLFVLAILGTAAYRYRGIEPSTVVEAPISVKNSSEANSAMYSSSIPAAINFETKEMPIWPLSSQNIICGFQTDSLVWSEDLQQWQTHEATDFSANAGEAVFSVLDGIVTEAYFDSLYGNTIIINHGNGRVISYSSLNTLKLVSVGQKIKKGEVISAAGTCLAEDSFGTHIHIEYFQSDERMDFEKFMIEETGIGYDPLQD